MSASEPLAKTFAMRSATSSATSSAASLSDAERERYDRQLRLPSCGEEGQLKLKAAQVWVIGAGGLGCAVLTALVSAGVGRITIFDFDHVSSSNLHRQPLYTADDIGQLKVEVAQRRLTALNPHVHLEVYSTPLRPLTELPLSARESLSDLDLIIDCVDRFDARLIAAQLARSLEIPYCYGAVSGLSGQVALFEPGHACLRCLFPELPGGGVIQSCDQGGVLGVAPQLIGSMQAALSLNTILRRDVRRDLNQSDSSEQKLMSARRSTTLTQVSLDSLEMYQLRIPPRDECHGCLSQGVDRGDLDSSQRTPQHTPQRIPYPLSPLGLEELLKKNDLLSDQTITLIDVRTQEEHERGSIPGAHSLPLAQLMDHLDQCERARQPSVMFEQSVISTHLNGDLIFYCERGPRAERALSALLRFEIYAQLQNLGTLYELVGGYQAWLATPHSLH